MTDAELDAIKARCDAATSGPWTATFHANGAIHVDKEINDRGPMPIADLLEAGVHTLTRPKIEDNAIFIAAARSDVPALLDEVAFLKSLLHDRIEDSTLAKAAVERERAEQEAKQVEPRTILKRAEELSKS